jgi:hypothetical protein
MTTENQQPQARVRYRININRLAKGQLSFDCTVELDGPVELIGVDHDVPCSIALGKLQEAALEESDRLVAALQAKYPMGVE